MPCSVEQWSQEGKRLVSLTAFLWDAPLGAISRHMRNNSDCFHQGQNMPGDLIAFYDEVTGFTDEGKEEDIVCPENVVSSESFFVPEDLQKPFLLQKPFTCLAHPLLIPAPAELQFSHCIPAWVGRALGNNCFSQVNHPSSTLRILPPWYWSEGDLLPLLFNFLHIRMYHTCALCLVILKVNSQLTRPLCSSGLSHVGSCLPDPWENESQLAPVL